LFGVICTLALVCGTPLAGAHALTLTVLHAFTGTGGDGVNPFAGVLEDSAGNLYGTTALGGDTEDCHAGCGTVFKIAADGTETVLYAFTGAYKTHGADGHDPQAGLIADGSGNLYGTTDSGGDTKCTQHPKGYGCGVVFQITAAGAESVLYAFKDTGAGVSPGGSLLLGTDGNLYGTTTEGGKAKCTTGCGTVFAVKPNGSETVLHAFTGGKDGDSPAANLIADSAGNLYGTTAEGGGTGCSGARCGTVFKVTPDGKERVLYAFKGGKDGAIPESGLIMDGAGNLYGTTYGGGGSGCSGVGCGTVFKVTPEGHEKTIYAFQGSSDGAWPSAGLTADTAGNLYGTTESGGGGSCTGGCGTVFELVRGTTEQVLYTFTGGSDGAAPYGGVIVDVSGDIFGTTVTGGDVSHCDAPDGCGVVFKLSN
jgi:uncharacterized repeat protein (TIGR03803 family)